MALDRAHVDFLDSLLKSEVFQAILTNFASFERDRILAQLESAHACQNVHLAAFSAGELRITEGLPSALQVYLGSQAKAL